MQLFIIYLFFLSLLYNNLAFFFRHFNLYNFINFLQYVCFHHFFLFWFSMLIGSWFRRRMNLALLDVVLFIAGVLIPFSCLFSYLIICCGRFSYEITKIISDFSNIKFHKISVSIVFHYLPGYCSKTQSLIRFDTKLSINRFLIVEHKF